MRGTDLSALVSFDEEDDQEARGLIPHIDDGVAGVVGFLAPVTWIALLLASGYLPLAAAVLLSLASLAWLGLGLAAGWVVAYSDEEEHPAWAEGMVAIMVTLGKVIIIGAVIASVLAVVFLLMALIAGAMSDRN